jgi:hypothetical protein
VQIVTAANPDRALLAAAIRRQSRGSLWLLRAMGIALVLAAALDLLTGDTVPAAVGVLLGVLVAVAAPVWLVSRAVDRCWLLFGTPASFEISDIGVQRTDALTRHAYAWPAVKSVEELSGQVIFSVGPGFVPMPTSALVAGQLEHVLGMAAFHGVPVQRQR